MEDVSDDQLNSNQKRLNQLAANNTEFNEFLSNYQMFKSQK